MSSIEPFSFAAAHPRRSANSTQRPSDLLTCLGKKYSVEGRHQEQGINVVFAHANGFGKELYEPFIECLLQNNEDIQAVFVHDVVTQGASGRVNAEKLGSQYHWSDSGLDIIFMISHCRAAGIMDYQPIVGIGHSMGGCQLAYAAELHHRLFCSLILVDPIIKQTVDREGLFIASLSLNRRDLWPSREDAASRMRKSSFYKAWDPAVFAKWIEYGLTSTGNGEEVTLTTTPAQEVYAFLHYRSLIGQEKSDQNTSQFVFERLPYITVPVHFIFGETSPTMTPQVRAEVAALVQIGSRLDLEGVGHLVPMEVPELCAIKCAEYVREELSRHRQEQIEDEKASKPQTLTTEYKVEVKDALAELQRSAKL